MSIKINAKTKMCLIIGDPVEHSLSPQMHNAAYISLGIDDQFVFTAARVNSNDVGNVIEAVRTLGIRGLTLTLPHKIEVMKYLNINDIDEVAKKIGAVNTVVNDDGVLKGYNTDWLGILKPLEKMTDLKEKTVAVIGAGGAARAVAFAVTDKGAELQIYNRTIQKAQELAGEFGGKAFSLDEIEHVQNADIIFNATSVGMHNLENETPVPAKYLTDKHIVFDAIYTPYETKLLREAKENGAKIIHGLDMLLYQGVEQFELYTGQKAPEEIMRKVLMSYAK